jgi:diguanylate cyclase (GGDEF)-like protein
MANEYGISWIQPPIDSEQLLNQLISKIRAAQELSEMLNSIAAPIRQFLDVDRVHFYRRGQDDHLEVVAEAIKNQRLPTMLGTKIVSPYFAPAQRELLVSGQQQSITDPTTLQAMGMFTCLLLPIVHQQQIWGFLACQQRQSKRFSSKQLHTLHILIDQISIGIAQAELVARAHLQNQQERLIQRISSLLQAPSPHLASEQQLLVELSTAFQASSARLYIIAEPINSVAQIYTHGRQPALPMANGASEAIAIETNALWQRAVYHHRPTHSTQVYAIADIYQQSILEPLYFALHQTGIQSLLIMPLRYSQQCIGCLTLFRSVGDPTQWTAAAVQLAEALTVHLYTGIMQQRIESMFRQQSYYDLLTGLPNRLLLQQRLTLALAKTQERGELLAVIFLDLDRFKNINDILGHDTGDRLLQMVTARLQQAIAVYDVLGRWGGDEFTFLVSSFDDMTELHYIAKTILHTLTAPFEFEDVFPYLNSKALYVRASMGIAIAPYDGEDSDTLLKHAHTALYRAKQQGRNHYDVYSSALSSTVVDRLRLENILYQAINDGSAGDSHLQDATSPPQQFVLHYQPQIDIASQRVIGVEALIRCYDCQAQFISPAEFIPVAEETGLINQIGEWVINTACEQNKLWQEQAVGYFPIAVNLSIKQIQQPDFVEIVTRALERSGLAPEYLEVEITESLAIQDLNLTIAVLQKLRAQGIKVSLDDFGTGHSSLAALKHLPLDHLKVDRSFIKDLTADSIDAGIVRTIINLGHELKLQVIAEGVETIEQLDFLRSVGCDGVQGFFFSKPLPAAELAAKITKIQNQLAI